MMRARSVVAVLGGLMLLASLSRILVAALINALAGGPLEDAAAFLNARPGLLASTLVPHGMSALLAGYMIAKIAGRDEVLHALFAAALQTAVYVWGFTMSPEAALTPVWMRVALVALTGPAMVAGAAVRAGAASQRAASAAQPGAQR